MALTKQADPHTIYLQVKDFSIWQELKKPVEGCESITVTNPTTKEVLNKYGYHYKSVEGLVVALRKYDNENGGKRYFGFRLHLIDGADTYVLDMSYQGQLLRRFLRCAPNFDWTLPLSISAFKSKKENPGDTDSTGIWFQQRGQTVKPYYTRETPHGMPEPTQDEMTREWDFKPQQKWLVDKLYSETIPAIEAAARYTPRHEGEQEAPHAPITDEECPF